MTTLAIHGSERATPSQSAEQPQWRGMAACATAWWAVIALMLLGDALGLL